MYKDVSKAEQTKARKLVLHLLKNGYRVTVWNGGDEPEISKADKFTDIINAMGESDEDRLNLSLDGMGMGSVLLVYGNSGEELIADYSMSLKDLIKEVEG